MEILANAGAKLDLRNRVSDYCIKIHLNTLYLRDRLSAYHFTFVGEVMFQLMLSTIPVALIRAVKRL